MAHRRRLIIGCVGVSVLGAGLVSAGCSRADQYRMDPTPRIMTRSETHQEVANSLTMTDDTNFRLMWNDIGRLMFLDKPMQQLDPGPNFR